MAEILKKVDIEDIGTLAVPTPEAVEMIERLKKNFAFLADLDDIEQVIAKSNQKDRSLVIQTLLELPDNRLKERLY